MKIQIINQTQARIPRAYLQRFLDFSVASLKKKNITALNFVDVLTLVFLNRSEAAKLNLEFRGKNYATDVLSFESLEEESLGELVFCYDVLVAQAKEHKLPLRDELAYLMLHGLLHLLGFEHEQGGEEAEKMYQIQDEIYSSIQTQSQK